MTSWQRRREQVLVDAERCCEFCGTDDRGQRTERRDNQGLHVHHIIPRAVGGNDDRSNLIALCDDCHSVWEARTNWMIEISELSWSETKAKIRDVTEEQKSKGAPSIGVPGGSMPGSVRSRPQVPMYLPKELRNEFNSLYERLDARSKLAGEDGIEKHKDFMEAVVQFAIDHEADLADELGVPMED